MKIEDLLVLVLGVVGLVTSSDGQEAKRKVDAMIIIDTSDLAPSPNIDIGCKEHASAKPSSRVCGRNGVTYPSLAYIKCLNRKLPYNKRIVVGKRGPCTESFGEGPNLCENNMLYEPVCGSDNRTYANIDALNCKNIMNYGYNVALLRKGECEKPRCPSREEIDKVCASNGITYRNVGEVRCLKKYNPDLRILHSGGCTVREVRRNLGKRMSCHMSKNRFEWNPICSSGNVTYANPYLYICHHPRNESKCGARPGECGTLQELACTNVVKINKHQMESSALVCGSNKLTYRSYEHLHCASVYDKHLSAISVGKCGRSYDPCELNTSPLQDKGRPVCGSDNLTYVSIEALWCVKNKMRKNLTYVHDGRCL